VIIIDSEARVWRRPSVNGYLTGRPAPGDYGPVFRQTARAVGLIICGNRDFDPWAVFER
jgi:hypothetical protein